ncbi:polymer-forming cytoskeletal protein [Deinococcus daejeonensis]|uniref:polymer-forming cytoskeletal protein n=1 Tax=Deinococcus daejeonensis TaxID=1007098 RepID=UPI001668AEE8|nr:polymer-forming cytoskeletal protein [Deinococcus daejeonensis]
METLRTGDGRAWLELLHREADGDLTPADTALLRALPPEVQAQRTRLARVAPALRAVPELPRSVAADVAREVRLSARLVSPPLSRSLAAQVAAEVALSVRLSEESALPRSVAAAVARDVRLEQALTRVPAMSGSVAASVAREIRLGAQLATPPLPRSVAASVVQDLRLDRTLGAPVPAMPGSVAAAVAQQVRLTPPEQLSPAPAAAAALIGNRPRNPAPLIMVVSLLVALTLLAVSTAWPNLAAGALVLQTLLAQVSPLAGVGLLLLLVTSAAVTWRPAPAAQRFGGLAFAVSAALTLPALYGVVTHGTVSFGRDVVVHGPVKGNVLAAGGNIVLAPDAQVDGEVVTLLGDIRREAGAQVGGSVTALLGQVPGDSDAREIQAPSGLGAVTAAAFRPVLGWLGGAAWPQVFVGLTGGALLMLFVSGLAPLLARRQRHAPVRTLALGVLSLAALLGPAGGLALAGLLGPALLAAALAVLLIAVGLSVSAYDAGRALAYRAGLPVPDAVGAMVGLSAVAASLSVPPLAFALALVGGTWGAGTLLLSRVGSPADVTEPQVA